MARKNRLIERITEKNELSPLEGLFFIFIFIVVLGIAIAIAVATIRYAGSIVFHGVGQ